MSAARLYSKKARTRALADTVEPVPARADSVTRVVAQFRVIFNAVKAHLQDVERRAGIGGAQVWALSCIRDQPGLGVNDLARALKVRQPTASSLVKALVAQGFVELRRDGQDRRSVQLYVRAEGRKVLRRAPSPHNSALPQALLTLDDPLLRHLEGVLNTVISHLATSADLSVVDARKANRRKTGHAIR